MWLALALGSMIFAGGALRCSAQVTTSTLTGTVTDADGAIIPSARVTIVNENNKFTRTVEANSSGVFTFASIASGDYDLKISYKGFSALQITKVHLDPGDTRTLANLKLKIGEVTQVINVEADNLNHVEDTGERSSIITSKDLQKLTLEGRDVTELLKILPGSAIGPGGNNGTNNGNGPGNVAFDSSNVQIGGAAGSYAMSGSPTNGVSITSDGANLTDPGTYSGGLQTVNGENTAEVKVQQGNFGADTANGPLVINAVGKSGGSSYHGELYAFARTYQLNATDSFSKEVDAPKPPDRYVYPGGQIGGPVKIPGTDFNHNKKLTFFVSGEDYAQRNTYAYGSVSSAIQTALVPTAAMRNGDLSPTQLYNYLPPGTSICLPGQTCPVNSSCVQGMSCVNNTLLQNLAVVPLSSYTGVPITCNGVPGDCLAPFLDPNIQSIYKLAPLPNLPGGVTRSAGGGGGYNYLHVNLVPNNFWQTYAKVEYSASDRQKFAAVYSAQMGNSTVPQGLGYYASSQDSGGLNAPGGSVVNTHTQSASFNWTSIWSSSLTNELSAAAVYNDHYYTAGNINELLSSSIGFMDQGAYANDSKEFPSFQDYGFDGLPVSIFPDYSYGPNFIHTLVPTLADNLTKTVKTHTVKFGFDFERPDINDYELNGNSGSNTTNGAISNYYVASIFHLPGGPTTGYHNSCFTAFDNYCSASNGTSNSLANFLMGDFSGYTQGNLVPHLNLYNWTNSFYAQDDWKLRKNFSITYGLRFEHEGRWSDAHGAGAAVWRPDLYPTDTVNNPLIPLPGFRWHGIDKSVPIGGFASRAFFYAPRAGFSWDVYKDGKTTFSGGWGMYRSHEGESDAENYLQTPAGVRSANVTNPNGDQGLRYSYINGLNLNPSPTATSSTFSNANTGYYTTTSANLVALDSTDSQSPLTTNYNFTVTQQLPTNMVFSIAYVGNKSTHLLNDGANQTIFDDNINALPVGALFTPDPNPQSKFYGVTYTAANLPGLSGSAEENDWRPYREYGNLQVASHALYANYNSLQTTLSRSKGIATFSFNYTYSKAMGVRGSYFNGIPGDSFNMRNNYGPLSFDRTHIVNATYFFNFATWYHGNRFVRGVVDGWQVSGYTGVQSGPNLQATNYVTNFGITGQIAATGNQQAYNISNITYLGTPDVQLQPLITCNPTGGLAPKQYINGNCFALPAFGGANGPFITPYIHGPAYWDSDLTVIRGVKLPDSKSLEFRIAGFNFLNNKLNTFSGKAPGETQLEFPYGDNPGFGHTQYTVGRRVIELAAKFIF
jgi:hypothetical protein